MEVSYCSRCQKETNWLEFSDYWECVGCKRRLTKLTYEQAQKVMERIQERWSELEKHPLLQKQENKEIAELFMNGVDHKLYHLRLINGDI